MVIIPLDIIVLICGTKCFEMGRFALTQIRLMMYIYAKLTVSIISKKKLKQHFLYEYSLHKQ